jgi:hypothetical protein
MRYSTYKAREKEDFTSLLKIALYKPKFSYFPAVASCYLIN